MAKKKKQDKKVDQAKVQETKTDDNAPVKKSEVVAFMHKLISEGKHERKKIIKQCEEKFTDKSPATFSTYLADGKNLKYSAFKNDKGEKLIVEVEKGFLKFK